MWRELLVLTASALFYNVTPQNLQRHSQSGDEAPLEGFHLDLREIQRQNQITTQILQNYLEKRLFGNNRSSKPPSLWEILPRTRRKPKNNIQEVINGTLEGDKESLQSVESERVSAYEDYLDREFDENEGRIFFFIPFQTIT
ncbi:hypothetical protein NQ315_006302 [Exocentrus adspersus]|uniref:Uncharacterized protein n=1 Tax=Exocentrus adspersus TaxID=1586481 RepID=A0AAV8VZV3_9CUCU|nr:hypothetical protein NQ315_006302 [Exocentrus adspersus]